MSRIGSFPFLALFFLGFVACTDGAGAPSAATNVVEPAQTVATTDSEGKTFWPTKVPPRCYTEGGLTRVVTGEAVAVIDRAGSLTRRQPLAIAYNPATARNGGTGHIAVWSDYDTDLPRWACKQVTDHVIEMVRNGMGATIKVRPEPDGTVKDFRVARLHTIYGFTFDIWRDEAVCPDSLEPGTTASC